MPDIQEQLNDVRGAIRDLSDGKLDRGDARAIAILLGAIAGILALALQTYDRLAPESDPAPVGVSDSDDN